MSVSDFVYLKIRKSPFNADLAFDLLVPYEKGMTLVELAEEYLPQQKDISFAVMMDMAIIPPEKYSTVYLMPCDTVTCIPCPAGGNIGDFLGVAVAILAIAVSAGALAPVFGASFAAGSFGAIAASIGISVLGGLAVSALSKPPEVPSIDVVGFERSSSYSWNPKNTQEQGICIPRAYGTQKFHGNIIAAYIENVNDKQYINLLCDLGIFRANRLYDFKINGQPAMNYDGVEIYSRLGELDQDPVPFFGDTKREYVMQIKVTKDNQYLYTTENDDFDGLEIDITFPALYQQNTTNGNIQNVSVNIKIEISETGENNWRAITSQVIEISETGENIWRAITSQVVEYTEEIVTGRWSAGYWYGDYGNNVWVEVAAGDSNPYSHYEGQPFYYFYYHDTTYWRWIEERTVRQATKTVDYCTVTGAKTSALKRTFKAQNLSRGKYDIRVTRLTDDHTSSYIQSDMYVTAVREVLYDDFQYPRHTYFAVRALATDQLSGPLEITCKCKAALVNVYNGESWTVQFSNNPAWVAFDMATQPVLDNDLNIVRYDMLDPSEIDIEKHYELAQRCDELVPDGKGGEEHLFEFDAIFDATQTLWDALFRVYKSARAVPFWQGTTLTCAINKPRDVRHTLTMGSIVRNSFQGQWSSYTQRATEIRAEFMNKDKAFDRDVLPVYHPENRYYMQPLNMDFFGVTRPSQIARDAYFHLICNRELTMSVGLTAPVTMIEATLGDIIEIAHDMPRWRLSGLLQAVEGNNIVVLDRKIELEEGETYTIHIKHKETDTMIERTIYQQIDDYTLQVSVPFDDDYMPGPHCEYHIGKISESAKPFSILSIKPQASDKNEFTFALNCIEYNETVYNSDYGLPVVPTTLYSIRDTTPKIKEITIEQVMEKSGSAVLTKAKVSAICNNNIDTIDFKIYVDGTYHSTVRGMGTSITVPEGSSVSVTATPYNMLGKRGESISKTQQIIIQSIPPADIQNLRYNLADRIITLSWDANTEVDFDHYLVVVGDVNHPEDAIIVNNTSFSHPVRSGQYTFNVYAVDYMGNRSTNPATVTVDVEGIFSTNYLIQDYVDLSTGTFEGTICYTDSDQLRRPSAHGSPITLPIESARDCDTQNYINAFDDVLVSDLNYLVSWFSTMDFTEPGIFTSQVIDLGKIYEGYLSFDGTRSYTVYDTVADIKGAVSEFEDVLVSDFQREVGTIKIRAFISEDNVLWKEVLGGWIKARYLQFKVYFDTRNPAVEHRLTDLWYQIDVPDLHDSGNAIITNSGTINYNKTFNTVKSVVAAALGGGQVDITSYNETGFLVEIVGGGTKTILWQADGY